jgi:hypothetical protein
VKRFCVVSILKNTIPGGRTCVSKCFDDQGDKSVFWFNSLLPHAFITKVFAIL